jgi:hypothetical protein
MSVWVWAAIGIAIAVVLGVIAAWRLMMTRRLKGEFKDEYDRTVEESGGRFRGESELRSREKRRQQLDIRPLSDAAHERFRVRWEEIQVRFVDQPEQAVRDADRLVIEVMRTRGYPMEDFEQRAADISVDHPHVVDNYRAAHAIAESNENRDADTEDLRRAVVHYRGLFEELLGSPTLPVERAGRKDTTRRVS